MLSPGLAPMPETIALYRFWILGFALSALTKTETIALYRFQGLGQDQVTKYKRDRSDYGIGLAYTLVFGTNDSLWRKRC